MKLFDLLPVYDVFCGAGGCTKGYQRAGFYVIGVDNKPQRRYCGDEFIQMDAFEFFKRLLLGAYPEPLFIHVSPPCQKYSKLKALVTKEYPDLIGPVRKILQTVGRPYIIENVPGAPLINPLMLCGSMFPGLRVYRHRLFECEPVIWWPPAACSHWGVASASGRGKSKNNKSGYAPGNLENFDFITVVGNDFIAEAGRQAMGINWMTKTELSQAIPPAYTEWLGRQMLEAIR